jgi:hypothetical protein
MMYVGGMTSAIATAAGADLAAVSGSPGHLQARHWYEGLDECDAKHNLIGLHYYVRGDYDEAIRHFRKCGDSMSAKNNLGAALSRKGDAEGAKKAWGEVTEGEFAEEARYNLTGTPECFWGEHAKKYFPGEPLLTPPSSAEWQEMLGAASPVKTFLRKWAAVPNVFAGIGEGIVSPELFFIMLILLVAVLVMAIGRFFSAPIRLEHAESRGLQWWAAVLIPGTARQWQCFGGLFLTILIGTLFLWHTNSKVPGTLSIIEAIAFPNISVMFGTGYEFHESTGLRRFLASWPALLPFVLFVLNLLFMIVMRVKFAPRNVKTEVDLPVVDRGADGESRL